MIQTLDEVGGTKGRLNYDIFFQTRVGFWFLLGIAAHWLQRGHGHEAHSLAAAVASAATTAAATTATTSMAAAATEAAAKKKWWNRPKIVIGPKTYKGHYIKTGWNQFCLLRLRIKSLSYLLRAAHDLTFKLHRYKIAVHFCFRLRNLLSLNLIWASEQFHMQIMMNN